MHLPKHGHALLLTIVLLVLAVAIGGCSGGDGGGDDDGARAKDAAGPESAEDGRPVAESGGDGVGTGTKPVVTPSPRGAATIAYCTGVRGAEQAWARGVTCGEATRLLAGFDAEAGTSPALRAAGWTCARGGESGGVVEYSCSDGTGTDAGTVGIQVLAP